MALARSYHRFAAVPPMVAWGLTLLGGLLIVFNPLSIGSGRLLAFGLPAGLIVAGALMLDVSGRRATKRAAILLGAISYALYLSHNLVFAVIRSALIQSGLRLNAAESGLLRALSVSAALAVAWLIHATVEQPAARWLKRGPPALELTRLRAWS